MRIGHGFDVHRFAPGDGFKLGGVWIAYRQSLQAHSDGDVLLHALCDALLGAAGLGDIGQHFPDSDAQYTNIDSRVLLRQVFDLVQQQGLQIANLDTTIIAQQPKLAPYRAAMRTAIAEELQLHPSQVNVKATTTEGLGYLGRGEGIAAHCVVLLQPM